MCNNKERYIWKMIGSCCCNVIGFKSIINQEISDCRSGNSTYKFLIHVYHCAMKNEC